MGEAYKIAKFPDKKVFSLSPILNLFLFVLQ